LSRNDSPWSPGPSASLTGTERTVMANEKEDRARSFVQILAKRIHFGILLDPTKVDMMTEGSGYRLTDLSCQ
jgi:hypothetical protein